ncbi:hypothetical protein GGH18_003808, partial [Coemansia sp. RSA 530]
MGRTGHTLRSHSSHGHTSRLHPYAHQTTLLQTPKAHSQPSDTRVLQSSCQSDTRISGIVGSGITQVSPNPIVQTPATDATTLASSSAYMDDNWSPFDSPLVQECIASRTQSLPSLLEHKNHTPLYTPSPNTRVAGSVIRNPSMFATTYAGHVFANEQINMRIVDLESGEYLQRFPVCQRDAR